MTYTINDIYTAIGLGWMLGGMFNVALIGIMEDRHKLTFCCVFVMVVISVIIWVRFGGIT